MASYPSAIKTFPQLEDGVDTVFALHPNERGDEITAIETELGLLPKGSEATAKARLELGPLVKLTNQSGSSRAAGDVVVLDTGNNNSYTTTTTQGLKRAIFVVRETTANAAEGHVLLAGRVQLQATGAVTRGNYLRTSTTAAKAEDAGASIVDGVFAIALETIAGAGLVWVQLLGITLEAELVSRDENVMRQGSFEVDTDADGYADNWAQTGGLAAPSLNADGQFGNSSQQATYPAASDAGYISQSLTISATVNTYFRGATFSGWARARQASGVTGVLARLEIYDGVSATAGTPVTLPDSGAWVTVTVTKTLSASATELTFRLRINNGAAGTAVAKWDGACLVMAGTPTEFVPHVEDTGPYT